MFDNSAGDGTISSSDSGRIGTGSVFVPEFIIAANRSLALDLFSPVFGGELTLLGESVRLLTCWPEWVLPGSRRIRVTRA